MRERPILFSGPMVRALLDGRKTQTRRVVKPAPTENPDLPAPLISFNRGVPEYSFSKHDRTPKGDLRWYRCPYGAPGDRLWVRETWCEADTRTGYDYAARFEHDTSGYGWRPSIHMPRAASRLTLEITEVRVERLQDISEADAIAEGATPRAVEGAVGGQRWCMDWSRVGSVAFGTTRIRPQDIGLEDPQMAFANYINKLHGGPRWNFYYNGDARYPKPIWDVNPWVWAITFRVLP